MRADEGTGHIIHAPIPLSLGTRIGPYEIFIRLVLVEWSGQDNSSYCYRDGRWTSSDNPLRSCSAMLLSWSRRPGVRFSMALAMTNRN